MAERTPRHFIQPDQRSCGAAVLVTARFLTDPPYARLVDTPAGFRAEVLATHRRVTSPSGVPGRTQLPWPRALGTPPWAVAHELGARTGVDHRVRVLLPWSRGTAYDEIGAAGRPVPVYVGNRWLPRHVVLAIGTEGEDLRVYEPASGRVIGTERAAFVSGDLDLAGWETPWFMVLPKGRRTRA